MTSPRSSFLRYGRMRSQAQTSIGYFTRMRAWWLGVDDAEMLQRYGERSLLRHIWEEWRGTLLIVGCLFSFVVGSQQSSRANYILENIELNRKRFYGKEFAPDYVTGAPGGVYDGAKGYSFQDERSGLRTNADNHMTTSLTGKEMRERISASGAAAVSSEMVSAAEEVLCSERYMTRGSRS